MKSTYALIAVSLIWIILGSFYYPKWNKQWSEAAISWDASGYYHYLPAVFIYHDLRQQAYMDTINKKYLPSPAYDQSFVHGPSGNKVNKYAIGQAVLFSPFFFIAHSYAKFSGSYPADGYSKPYQIAIWLSSSLVSILGLILLSLILNKFFADRIAGFVILALGLGTHWIEYASISNGMNHTWLFTLLCALLLFVIRFYKNTDWFSAIGIGSCLGLALLTRPTEIVWFLLPLLWNIESVQSRFQFLIKHWQKCLIAIIIAALIISLQPIYWKYASGEWLVKSYGDQGFNWLHPKIWRGLMGANLGWWLYTPIMLVAMAGWICFYKSRKSLFWSLFITTILAIYITLSWGHWEGGGGLGQRNLIQIYPLLAFPLACIIAWMDRSVYGRWIWIIFLLINIYYTGWWVHQAHKGGFFQPGQMNTRYFMNVAGRINPDRDYFKLLDTKEYFKGTPKDLTTIFSEDFESDSLNCEVILPDSTRAACLNAEVQFIGPIVIPVENGNAKWLRLEGNFTILTHEWDIWKYAQWIIQFYSGDEIIKTNFIRPQRLIMSDNVPTRIFFDVKVSDKPFDKCVMTLWNAESKNTIAVDNLNVSQFDE